MWFVTWHITRTIMGLFSFVKVPLFTNVFFPQQICLKRSNEKCSIFCVGEWGTRWAPLLISGWNNPNKKTLLFSGDLWGPISPHLWSRFAVRYHPPPPAHMVWSQNPRFAAFRMKRGICSVFCMVGCWHGPQTCKFVGFLQPAFRKRVICNVSATTSWSSAVAPSSISMSNYHIILHLLLKVYSLGNRSDICLYLLVKLSLRVSSFP